MHACSLSRLGGYIVVAADPLRTTNHLRMHGVLRLQTYRHGVGFHGIIDGGGMVAEPEDMDDGFDDDPEVCPELCSQPGSCAPAA